MNYLAHAYLSFKDAPLLAGNMLSDHIKGKKKLDYPPAIQEGIVLHRLIDEYTDGHAATREIKAVFKQQYGLYSAVFSDVVYDHFLATDPLIFTAGSLQEFADWVYITLDDYVPIFPASFSRLFPYMKSYNWLFNYRNNQGIENSFRGLMRRAQYMEESDTAFRLFEKHYDSLRDSYRLFMPQVTAFAQEAILQIRQTGNV